MEHFHRTLIEGYIPSGKEAITVKKKNTSVSVMFALELKKGCEGSIECARCRSKKLGSVANCSGKSVVIYDAGEYGSVF